jgi:hypothetical protein
MNIDHILIGAITGVLTGLLAGYFGVVLALKHLREQRAFDKQLEWYERTIRALGNLSRLTIEMEIAAKPLDIGAWEKGKADLQQCLDEAALYADQESYWELFKTVAKWDQLKEEADQKGTVREFGPVVGLLRSTLINLSKPIRERLGFKEIKKK